MINLTKMNIYRMLHMKSMYIVLFCLLAFGAFGAYVSNLEISGKLDQIAQQAEEEETQILAGVEISKEPETSGFGINVERPVSDGNSQLDFQEYFCADISSGLMLIFFSIATALFVYAEEKTGFVKNISGQTRHKAYIYLSKLGALLLYYLISMVFYGILLFIMLKYFHGSELAFGMEHAGRAFRTVSLQFLLHTAFASGLVMLVTICKSTTIAITIGILSACGFGTIITNGLNQLLNLDLSGWMVSRNVQLAGFNASRGDMSHALTAGILFLILYNVAGTYWFVKKDVV